MPVQEAEEVSSHPSEVSYNGERENIDSFSDFEESGSEYKPSSDLEDSDSISHSNLEENLEEIWR